MPALKRTVNRFGFVDEFRRLIRTLEEEKSFQSWHRPEDITFIITFLVIITFFPIQHRA